MSFWRGTILGIVITVTMCETGGVDAQATQPTGDAEHPQLSPAEQTAEIRSLLGKYDNEADQRRAIDQRKMTELASKLRLTAAQEEKITPDYLLLDYIGQGLFSNLPLPNLVENGARDPQFPKVDPVPGDNTDNKVYWSALVSLVEALDDPVIPNDVLRSRITTMHEATAKTQADWSAAQERVISVLNGRQIAMLPATVVYGEKHPVTMRSYTVKVSGTAAIFVRHFNSDADPYGAVYPELHAGIQAELNLNDDEYGALKPKIDAVLLSRAKTNQPLAFFNFIRSKRGRPADLADRNYDGVAGVMVNLDVALRDPDTPDDVFVQEENDLAAAVRDAHKDFIKAEGELRSLLTPRQEAILMVEGVLE